MVLEREKGSLLERECFFRPGASVHIDHSALISLFPLFASRTTHVCPPARRSPATLRTRAIEAREHWMDRWLDGWKEGDCSASPAPSSEDLNNSGNPNTHFMQIASTRLQAEEGSPLFSPPPAEEGRKQKPDPNPSPCNLVLGSSSVCEPRSQLPWALHCREIGHRKMLLTWCLQQQTDEGGTLNTQCIGSMQ